MKILLAVGTAAVAAWIAAMSLASPLEQPLTSMPADAQFDGNRAFEALREFVTRFPRRVIGSIEARQSTGFIKERLISLGYSIQDIHFNAVIDGARQTGRNVLARREGRRPEIIALVAHYDTAKTTYQGAMDNGSGVAVLLELARIFSMVPTERTLLLIASDGEEWGMLGTRDLALNWQERDRIQAAVSLDCVAAGDLRQLRLEAVGQRLGYTPPWLRDLARQAAVASHLHVGEASGIDEHVERSLMISWTDQGPFLAAGIPAVNLGSLSTDLLRQAEIYHSVQDLYQNMKPSSLTSYGKAAESLVRRLDTIPNLPAQSMSHFAVGPGRYLSPFVVAFLHYTSFLPFLALLYFQARRCERSIRIGGVVREGVEYVSVLLVLGAAYATIPLVGLLRWLPRYSLYPATPKDPVLESPDWRALGSIFAVLVVAGTISYFGRRAILRNLPRGGFHSSKLVLMTILFVVSAVALQSNSYWAVTFLLIPATLWGLIGTSAVAGGRAANRIYIAAAGLPYYSLLYHYSERLGLGWKMLWYQILAMANGMFPPQGVLTALAVISLGFRFLAIQSEIPED